MNKILAGVAAIAASAFGIANAAHLGYVLEQDGRTFYSFNVNDPGTTTEVTVSGDTNQLDAFDFRPANGILVGFNSSDNRFYRVNPFTGVTTLIGTQDLNGINTTNLLDIDFNPTIDRLRLVTGNDDNIVFNPNNGATTVVTDLFYAVGDANEGRDPNILGNAYTNSFNGATSTVQYVLDAATNDLGILANNSGVITTVGAVTLNGAAYDFTGIGGFDIFFDAGSQQETAYALLRQGSDTTLFVVDLVTAALTEVGDFTVNNGNLTGLAIGVSSVAVPLPAVAPALFAGFAGLGWMRRRQKAKAQA